MCEAHGIKSPLLEEVGQSQSWLPSRLELAEIHPISFTFVARDCKRNFIRLKYQSILYSRPSYSRNDSHHIVRCSKDD
jgi:hypothetical protein